MPPLPEFIKSLLPNRPNVLSMNNVSDMSWWLLNNNDMERYSKMKRYTPKRGFDGTLYYVPDKNGSFVKRENSLPIRRKLEKKEAEMKAEENARKKKEREYLDAKEKRIKNARKGPPQGYTEVNEKNATHFQYQDGDIYIEKMPDYSRADNSFQEKYEAIQTLESFKRKQKSNLFRYLKKLNNQQGGKRTRKQRHTKKMKTRKH